MVASACLAGAATGAAAPVLAQQPAGSQPAPAKAESKAPPKTAPRKKDEAKQKLDPTSAQNEVEAGINALGQGRAEAAVQSLSNALAAASLPQAQTARALYYRGVAYRRTAKPAQAISDLTSALWIKGGLSDEQRADALQQRSAAYREAGLPDQAEPPGLKASQAAAKPAAGSSQFTSVAPAAPAASTSSGGFFSSLFGGGSSASASSPSPPQQQAAPARPAAPVPTGTSPTSTGSLAATTSGNASEAKPATRMVPVVSSGASLPMGFQDPGSTVHHVEVSTRARAAQPQPAPGAVSRTWDEPKVKQVQAPAAQRQATQPSTQVASAPPVSAAPAATAAQPRARAAAAPAAGGSVQVQVAAVRSATEAQGLASQLQTRYARELGGRAPVVDQTSVGTLGTLYRVQVGPFASARDAEPLCTRLKGDGLDCRVIGQ